MKSFGVLTPTVRGLVFETVQEFLEWQWSTTCGLFDPSLVTEERLKKYLASYTDEDGELSLDFRGTKHEKVTVCRLTAVKKDKNIYKEPSFT